MVSFYQHCFDMKLIVDSYEDKGPMFDQLFHKSDIHVKISKLITEFGELSKTGDMLELIECQSKNNQTLPDEREIHWTGMSHISFGVNNIEKYMERIVKMGGHQETEIHNIGKNKCCFFTDCEGNWIELIENH